MHRRTQKFASFFFSLFGQYCIDWLVPTCPWINTIFYVTARFDSTGSCSILLCLLTHADNLPSPLAFGSVSLIVSLFPLFICVSSLPAPSSWSPWISLCTRVLSCPFSLAAICNLILPLPSSLRCLGECQAGRPWSDLGG